LGVFHPDIILYQVEKKHYYSLQVCFYYYYLFLTQIENGIE